MRTFWCVHLTLVGANLFCGATEDVAQVESLPTVALPPELYDIPMCLWSDRHVQINILYNPDYAVKRVGVLFRGGIQLLIEVSNFTESAHDVLVATVNDSPIPTEQHMRAVFGSGCSLEYSNEDKQMVKFTGPAVEGVVIIDVHSGRLNFSLDIKMASEKYESGCYGGFLALAAFGSPLKIDVDRLVVSDLLAHDNVDSKFDPKVSVDGNSLEAVYSQGVGNSDEEMLSVLGVKPVGSYTLA